MSEVNGLVIPATSTTEVAADPVIWSPAGFPAMKASGLSKWNARLAAVITTGEFNWSAICDYGALSSAMEKKDKYNNQLKPAMEKAMVQYPICAEIMDKLNYISSNPGILKFKPGSGAERQFLPAIQKRLGLAGAGTPQMNMRAPKVDESALEAVRSQLEGVWGE